MYGAHTVPTIKRDRDRYSISRKNVVSKANNNDEFKEAFAVVQTTSAAQATETAIQKNGC